jgi:hypothetical protein
VSATYHAGAPRGTDGFAKLLAVAGTAFAALPFVALLFAAVAASSRAGEPLVDLVLPLALFPATAMGGILLVWASWVHGSRRWSVAAPLGLALVAFTVVIVMVTVPGLASVAREREGWPFVLAVASRAAALLASAALVVSGALLSVATFARSGR